MLFFSLNLSLIYNNIANNKVVQPITSIFLNFSIKFVWNKKKPNNITGTDAAKILKKNFLFLIKFLMSL